MTRDEERGLEFALQYLLNRLFEFDYETLKYKGGCWTYVPFPPCLIVREDAPCYDKILEVLGNDKPSKAKA